MTASDMAGPEGDLFAAQLCGAFPTLPEQRAIADAQAYLTELQGNGLVVAGR